MVDDEIITSIQVPSLIKDLVIKEGKLVTDQRGSCTLQWRFRYRVCL